MNRAFLKLILFIGLAASVLFFFTPIVYLFLTSFKSQVEIYQHPILPKDFDLENYLIIFDPQRSGRFIFANLISSIIASFGSVAIALPIGTYLDIRREGIIYSS
jgi:ABC-type glycerol-3-phosphate transport system permease component